MSTTTDVRLWGVRRNTSSSKPSYEVRWVVAGREKSRTRRTKALADSFLSELRQAMKRGESFDTATGLPESMLKAASSTTWYEYVLGYVDKRWPGAAANTRKSMLEALSTVTAALVQDRPQRPDFADLYRVLLRYALPPGSRSEERTPDVARLLRWLEAASVPVAALEDEEVVERALTAIALRLDGKAAAATVVRRKRAVFYNVLDMAATGKHRILTRNPLDTMKWKPPEVAEKVDRRSVVNPRQARELLTTLTYVGGRDRDRGRRLVAMFACMYYAGLRPAEAVNLRRPDCELPDTGWGRIYLSQTTPEVGKRYTDSGELHDSKGLKHRPNDEVRPVPTPARTGRHPPLAHRRVRRRPRWQTLPPAERRDRQLLHLRPGLASRPRDRPHHRPGRLPARRPPLRPSPRRRLPVAQRRRPRPHRRPPRRPLGRRPPPRLRQLHRRRRRPRQPANQRSPGLNGRCALSGSG